MRNSNGLVTLTKLLPAPEVGGSLAFQEALEAAFKGWAPKGCDPWYGLRGFTSQTWASASLVGRDDAHGPPSDCDEGDKVWYHIFGWDGNCASPEQELAAAVDPMARASWAGAIEKAGHVVQSWEQEVWKFERLRMGIKPGTEE